MVAFPNTAIRASAGSGKTFQLVNRYLALLAAGESPQGILATTFTRKAAGEIQGRVLLRLAKAALDESEAQNLGQQIGQPKLTSKAALAMLTKLLRSLHRLRISTLDAFFSRMASSFSLELGLSAGWSILDEVISDKIRGKAVRKILGQNPSEVLTMMRMLTKGDVLRSVSEEVHNLVIGIYSVYLETDKQAWHALQHRPKLTAEQLEQAILRLEGAPRPKHKTAEKTIAQDVQSLREENWNRFVESGLAQKIVAGEQKYSGKEVAAELADAYRAALEHVAAELVGRLVDQTHATYALLEHYDREYRILCRTYRGARFEDVTRLLADSNLSDRTDDMAHRMSSAVRHLLIDEFQDTSVSQWQVMRPIAKLIAGNASDIHSFFCVGDKKQAIYGWRGGSSALFDALAAELAALESPSLAVSFRSSPVIIDVVNKIFAGLAGNEIVERVAKIAVDWSGNFEAHSAHNQNYAGYVSLESAPRNEDGQTRDDATLAYAAQRIKRIAQEAPDCSIGVLVRKNNTVGQLILELGRLDVPASEEGGNPLSESPAVEIILSALTLADHPGDGPSRFHVANSALAGELNFPRWEDDLLAVQVALRIREQLMSEGYGRVIRRWTERIAKDCAPRDVSRLSQLVDVAFEQAPMQSLRPSDFVALIRKKRIQDPSASQVRIMTVHQAKGLEFDIVVLPELDEQLVGADPILVSGRPHPTERIHLVARHVGEDIRSLLPEEFQQLFHNHKAAVLRESLCVLYVAVTRAAHALHIILNPSKPNEKTVPVTYAGFVRTALEFADPLEPEQTYLEMGDPDWHAKEMLRRASSRKEKRKTKSEDEAAAAPLQIKLAPQKVGRSRGLAYMTPSGMEGGRKVSLASLFEVKPAAAFQRGTALHALFESIEWLDSESCKDDTLANLLKPLVAEPEIAGICKHFRAMLEKDPIRKMLVKADYAATLEPKSGAKTRLVVFRERRFAVEIDAKSGEDNAAKTSLLTGAFDRLVLRYEGDKIESAEILDYKTDSPRGDANPSPQEFLQQRTDFYRPQLHAYMRAVAAMTGLPLARIRSRLLFVSLGETILVPPLDT